MGMDVDAIDSNSVAMVDGFFDDLNALLTVQ